MPITKIENFQSFQFEIENAEKVLIKFEADWCMPCRAMAPVVEEIARQYPDLKILAVDVEGEGIETLLKKYGVQAVPTFVHLRKGTVIRSTSGTINKADLSSLIKEN